MIKTSRIYTRRFVFPLLFALLLFFTSWTAATAHKPEAVRDDIDVYIEDPEVSFAFYDELDGEPQVYVIETDSPFDLYVSLLVPNSSNPDGRYSAIIRRFANGGESIVATLDANDAEWAPWREEFAGDVYREGPEYRMAHEPPGRYEIEVSGEGDRGKYVLAVGEIELFGFKDALSVFTTLPQLKQDFFKVSPLTLFTGYLGVLLAIGFAALLLLTALVWALLARAMAAVSPGIAARMTSAGPGERTIRLLAGFALLLLGIHLWSWTVMALALIVVSASRRTPQQRSASI